MAELITIERHILEQQRKFPSASGELTQLLSDHACRKVGAARGDSCWIGGYFGFGRVAECAG